MSGRADEAMAKAAAEHAARKAGEEIVERARKMAEFRANSEMNGGMFNPTEHPLGFDFGRSATALTLRQALCEIGGLLILDLR